MPKAKSRSYRLSTSDLIATVPRSWFTFRTTAQLQPADTAVGQPRAVRAIEVGLEIGSRGFNIFAVGQPGSGKTTTLKKMLRQRAAAEPVPPDICYVYNFDHPESPTAVTLPAGKGRALARAMDKVVRDLFRIIPGVLLEGASGHIRAAIVAETKARIDALTAEAAQVAHKLGLALEETEGGMQVVPLYRGRPLDEEGMARLSASARRRLEKRIIEFQEQAESFAYARKQLEIDHDERIREAEKRAVTPFVEERFGALCSEFADAGEAVAAYLERAKRYCIENYHIFVPSEEPMGDEAEGLRQLLAPSDNSQEDNPETVLHVNVLVDRSDQSGAPVVIERRATAAALCGFFEYREGPNGLTTDHTLIKAGALHRAAGGYLLLQASDVLSHDNAWSALTRALRHREVHIDEGPAGTDKPRIAGALKPASVPLQVKVIVVGTYDVYHFLRHNDDNFNRLFKVLSDFEPTMPLTRENAVGLARFVGGVCAEEGYLPLSKDGMIQLLAHGARLANHKHRIVARYAALLDVVAEANMFARAQGAPAIDAQHVSRAVDEREYRHGAFKDAVWREIDTGGIIINTSGHLVGQINGIAVYDVGGTSFGTPVRITARTYAGRRGIVNIDREVNLSGAIHDKGSLILIGYIGGRFGLEMPVAFSASITFEQSYDEIDGDSASSAELYALLSSLSGCPMNQGIAVTGSINQWGEIQPIGGVNEKVEGVFRVCERRGLTGKQGVMIPKANVENLMVHPDVRAAHAKGLFHIYAVSTVDEGIEVLTGVPAGDWHPERGWDEGSINHRVQARLNELSALVSADDGDGADTTL